MMKHSDRFLRWAFTAIAALLLILPFQNCSFSENSGFQNFSSIFVASPNSSQVDRGGDGGGFEGKGEIFARTLPVMNCPATHDLFQSIDSKALAIDANRVFYKIVSIADCASHDTDATAASLERSTLQSKVLSFNGGLFFRDDLFAANGNTYLESWCRSVDQSPGNKIEVAVKQNYIAESSEIKVWTDRLGQAQESAFLVSQRTLNNQTLRYHNASFDLAIDVRLGRDTKNVFSAKMVYQEQGLSREEALSCRMGGAFDGEIWPAQMLDQKDIRQFKKMSNNDVIYLVQDSLGSGHLYLKNQVDNQRHDLFQGLGFKSVYRFLLTDDESQIVFSAARLGPSGVGDIHNLYRYDVLSKKLVQLNGSLNDGVQSVDDRFFLSGDSKYVVYRDGENLVPTKYDRESRYLKSVSLESLQRVQLHPNLGPDLEPQIYFALGNERIVFSIQNRFYFNNYQGTALVEQDLTSLYSSNVGVLDVVTRFINDAFGVLRSQLFFTELASDAWVRNNRQVPDRTFVYINNQKFETLELMSGNGSGVSKIASDSLVTDVLSGGSLYFGKNGKNQDVLIQNGSSVIWPGSLASVRSHPNVDYTVVVDTNSNSRLSRLTSLSSSAESNLLDALVWPEFIGPAVPSGVANEIYYWKYNSEKGGFSLFRTEIRTDGETQKTEIAQSFLPVNHLTDFQIIEGAGAENAKWAVVKGSVVENADAESLANERSVFWRQAQVSADLYLISLEGLGYRRINRKASGSAELLGSGEGVQAVWPVDRQQIFFTVGDAVSTRQVFFWKDENIGPTK